MSIPAHKVVAPNAAPGQVVNRDIKSNWEPKDQTLGDYLARKRRYEALDTVALEKINSAKKLTFEEWWSQLLPAWRHTYCVDKEAVQLIWKQAQENV